ncbi:Septin-2 [Acropora cervicornis]|uniref:Septin-2 n=1 Tax=Acropora cervicornis TaxID=6130 RepID=A0AAD9R6Y6_ACRCE|nr:Septin-2 [Acropora cervicornis]
MNVSSRTIRLKPSSGSDNGKESPKQEPEPGYVGFANLPNQVHRKSVKRDRIHQTVEIETNTVEIEEKGIRLRLTVVDTPGFADAVITNYVDEQYEAYLQDESGLNRRHIVDNRVHCCLYFVCPHGHGLKPIDIAFMKILHTKVNIVPVIAKADCLTKFEMQRLKRKASIPFAVIGSNSVAEIRGKQVRVRQYPWGVAEVENPDHCDFIMLRNITHMQDLKDVTQEVHYENYRAERLSRTEQGAPSPRRSIENMKRKSTAHDPSKLRRMQEMLAQMQKEMAKQKAAGAE